MYNNKQTIYIFYTFRLAHAKINNCTRSISKIINNVQTAWQLCSIYTTNRQNLSHLKLEKTCEKIATQDAQEKFAFVLFALRARTLPKFNIISAIKIDFPPLQTICRVSDKEVTKSGIHTYAHSHARIHPRIPYTFIHQS